MFYYSHHIGDFIKDTTNLDDHQLATYLRLLWKYYSDEKPIAGEIEDLAFALRSDEKTVRLLLRHYFTETPEGWANKRCDEEIEAFKERSVSSSKAAKTRWENAKAKQSQSIRNATASEDNANAQVSDANQEPITNNHKKESSAARGTRLPADWRPSPEDQDYCKKQRPDLRLSEVATNFYDYWIAQPGSKGRKADWSATWRGWVRKENPGSRPQMPVADVTAGWK